MYEMRAHDADLERLAGALATIDADAGVYHSVSGLSLFNDMQNLCD